MLESNQLVWPLGISLDMPVSIPSRGVSSHMLNPIEPLCRAPVVVGSYPIYVAEYSGKALCVWQMSVPNAKVIPYRVEFWISRGVAKGQTFTAMARISP